MFVWISSPCLSPTESSFSDRVFFLRPSLLFPTESSFSDRVFFLRQSLLSPTESSFSDRVFNSCWSFILLVSLQRVCKKWEEDEVDGERRQEELFLYRGSPSGSFSFTTVLFFKLFVFVRCLFNIWLNGTITTVLNF